VIVQLDLFADAPLKLELAPLVAEAVDEPPEREAPPPAPFGQASMFEDLEIPAAEEAFKTIYIHFETREDVEEFARLIRQPVTTETRRICYPAGAFRNGRWIPA